MSDNVTIAKSSYENWNKRDFDAFSEIMASGTLIMVGSGQRLEGREGARQFAEMWANGFPDGRVEIDNVIDGGDHVVIEYTGLGTQTGTLASPMGEIAPTNRPVTLQLCDVWRFEGGSAKSVAQYFDTGSLMMQLGLVPEAVGATT